MKRIIKWWPLLLLVLAGLIAAIVWRTSPTRAQDQSASLTQVFTVERGNLTASITPTGEVYAPRQASLNFDVNRLKLVALHVAPGQKVQAGEVLAQIETDALERAVIQAEADLTVAQDNLEKARAPYTDLDLLQAQVAVAQAEVALLEAQDNLANLQNPDAQLDLSKARLAVSQAEVALAEARDRLAQAQEGPTESELASAEAALKSAQEAYARVAAKPTREDVQAALWSLERAKNSLWSAQSSRDSTCGAAAEGRGSSAACDSANANVANAEISVRQAEIAYYDAQKPATEAELANALAQVQKAQETLDALKKGPSALSIAQAESQVAQAEYNLAKAQADLADIEAGINRVALERAQSQVARAEYDLASAKARLAEIQAGPKPNDIEVAQARTISAQANLEAAREALRAASMVAPFEGTIISVGAEVGDLVSSGMTVVTMANLENLRVNAIVDETDIAKLAIGQMVQVTFDAFPGRNFWGEVLEVPLQGRLSQNILIYEVPISLEGAEDVALKPGMTANLRIVVGFADDALLVPTMAIQQGEEGNVVMVQEAFGGTSARQVETGLSSGLYTEIRGGLSEGDQVVVAFQAQASSDMPFNFGGTIGVGGIGGGGAMRGIVRP